MAPEQIEVLIVLDAVGARMERDLAFVDGKASRRQGCVRRIWSATNALLARGAPVESVAGWRL
jgi:hypothetical protein